MTDTEDTSSNILLKKYFRKILKLNSDPIEFIDSSDSEEQPIFIKIFEYESCIDTAINNIHNNIINKLVDYGYTQPEAKIIKGVVYRTIKNRYKDLMLLNLSLLMEKELVKITNINIKDVREYIRNELNNLN